jgi:hypothetical protein
MLSIEELPSTLFPPHHTRFLNDLESACYGIAALSNSGKLPEYFETLLPFDGMNIAVVLKPTQRTWCNACQVVVVQWQHGIGSPHHTTARCRML